MMKPSFASIPQSSARPRVLMVTHVMPYPPAAGNEIRIYKMLSWFRRKGYAVTLVLKPLGDTEVSNQCILGLRDVVDDLHVFDNRIVLPRPGGTMAKPVQVDTDVADAELSRIQDGFCPDWFAAEVAPIVAAVRPDVVIAQYVFMSRILALPECGDALKIIDAHDLFCHKQKTVEQYGIKNYSLSLTEAQESALLRRADIVLAIQKAEQDELRQLVPEVEALLTSFDLDIHHGDPAAVVTDQVLIVASSNEFNVKGTQDFLDYTWPLVRAARPGARLRVIGKVCQFVHCDDPTVSLLGFVESLEAEYEQAAVVVNPCRVGTGLKIKTIEALAWGKAHVAWPSAADGLRELGDVPAVIVHDAVAFAREIARLLAREPERIALQQAAHAFIEQHFGSESVYAALTGRIDACRNHDIEQVPA